MTNHLEIAMDEAINLAKLSDASFRSAPAGKRHPPVGAVVLDKDGNIIGKGIHDRDPSNQNQSIWERSNANDSLRCIHGEYLAFLDALTRGATPHTLVTTLEPCSIRSSGVRLACSRTTAFLGIKEVYVGMLDPSYLVRGVGCQLLQTRGIFFNMFPRDKYLQLLAIPGVKKYMDDRTQAFIKGDVQTKDVVRGIDPFALGGSGLAVMGLSDRTLWQTVRLAHDLSKTLLDPSNPMFDAVVASFLYRWGFHDALNHTYPPLSRHSKIVKPLKYAPWFEYLGDVINGYLGLPKNSSSPRSHLEMLEAVVKWWRSTV
jgi:pyrimidine deaminase RibD-like protein